MNVVYYPVPTPPPNTTAPGAVPWTKVTHPAVPTQPMDAGRLALALAKDIDPCGAIPLLTTGGVQQIFDSMYRSSTVGTSKLLVADAKFAGVPGNWIKLFSELVAAATSLAIAEHVEGYQYCLSMQFCKEGAAVPPALASGSPSWPAAYVAALTNEWHVKTSSAASQSKLMPDYLIARQDKFGYFHFATLESKGRSASVEASHYPNFAAMKAQAQNAEIVAKSWSTKVPPTLERRILSLVAIRPKLKKPASRALRCRWANHRPVDQPSDPVPDSVGLRFAACSYAVQLHNTGFREVAHILADCLLGDRTVDPEAITRAGELGLSRRARGFFGIGDRQPTRGEVLISEGLLDQLADICKALRTDDPSVHRQVAERQMQFKTFLGFSESPTGESVAFTDSERGQRDMRITRTLGGLAIVTDVFPQADH